MPDKQQQLVDLIAEHLGVDKELIQPNADFERDLGADSLDTADLFIAVREQFGVRISKQNIEAIKTVADLLERVINK